MTIPYLKILSILLLYSLLLPNDKSVERLNNENEKIEKEIQQKDREIETLNERLILIRKKITDTTSDLNSKTRQAIKRQKDLITIQEEIEKIDLKLIEIESEIDETDIKIDEQKNQIFIQENKIDSIEKNIDEIILKFKERAEKTYRAGIKKTTSWKDKKYLKQLSKYADQTDLSKEEEYLSKLLILDRSKEKLEDALKRLEITLINKKELLNGKKKNKKKLINSKNEESMILAKLKKEKEKLTKDLENKKKQRQKTQDEIKTAQQIIKKLSSDKQKNEKIKQELIRIRLEKNQEISGNFSKMKGKLNWPVGGTITSRFGLQKNNELNTFTENVDIQIKCKNSSQIISVMDGIIKAIDYSPGYGNIILIDHGDGYNTVYGNIDEIFVYENKYVAPGEVIAKISKTRLADSYLRFGVFQNGKQQDPEIWLKKK